jgi:hypothetical protein
MRAKLISALLNVLNFQTLMTSQLLKAGEEIEITEAEATVVAEAAEATAVVMAAMAVAAAEAAATVIEEMMEALGEEEEEEEVAEEVEEAAAEEDIKIVILEEDLEIEDMTEIAEEVATAATITTMTAEAGETEVMVVAKTAINQDRITTMMTKVTLDQILPSLHTEEEVLLSLDKEPLLSKSRLELKMLCMLAT